MGERLGSKDSASTNNRHSVCFGGGFNPILSLANDLSPHRKSLSPTLPRSSMANQIFNEGCIFTSGLSSLEACTSAAPAPIEDDCKFLSLDFASLPSVGSTQSPLKSRKSISRSNIPVFVGKIPSTSQTLESLKNGRSSRKSIDMLISPEKIRTNNGHAYQKRASFQRSSFSSKVPSNYLSRNEHQEHSFETYNLATTNRGVAKTSSMRQSSHKLTQVESKKASHTSAANSKSDDYYSHSNRLSNNNGLENKNDNNVIASPNITLSPTTKSRIPVLRSSSCRSVNSTPTKACGTKSNAMIPKNVCFGHGASKGFQTNNKNWYQINSKTRDPCRRRSTDKSDGPIAMDTTSIMDSCNFNDMRMALD